MKKNLLWVSLTALLVLSVLSGLSVNTIKVSAVESPAIYIDPPAIIEDYENLPIGSNFTISIKTDCTQDDIWGYALTLSYDPNVLNGGINKTDTWTGDGSNKTFYLTGEPIAEDPVKVYLNQTLVPENIEGYDEWTGDGETGTFVTSKVPVVKESEEVYVNGSLQTRKSVLVNDTWIGDGSTKSFLTTGKPVIKYSETVKMNFTDTWSAGKDQLSYITTVKPVDPAGTENVTVDGTPQIRDVDYTVNYNMGNITFTTAPAFHAEVKAEYRALRAEDTDYTIDRVAGNITFTTAPAAGTRIYAEYRYGHYSIEPYWNIGQITFETLTIGAPGNGSMINATYLYEHHTVDIYEGSVTFVTAPGVGAEIKVVYVYGGVTNGDLITTAVSPKAVFSAGRFNNTEGTLRPTIAFFSYFLPPPAVTSGPGTLANVTFRVVGYGCSNITLGIQTSLSGWNFNLNKEYYIINAETMPTHIQHGYFKNKLNGDANGDGWVNSLDIGKINAHWAPAIGAPPWSLGYSRCVDPNNDGYINSLDVGTINANWGRTIY